MFQGSENFNESTQALSPIGAAVNGTTSNDRTNYYERVPREYLEPALWLESDRMENLLPALSQKKLDNQREVVKNERRQSYEDRPYGMFWLRLFDNLFPKGHSQTIRPLVPTRISATRPWMTSKTSSSNTMCRQTPSSPSWGTSTAMRPRRWFRATLGTKAGTRAPKPTVIPTDLAEDIHVVEPDEVKLPCLYYAWHTPALYEEEMPLWMYGVCPD